MECAESFLKIMFPSVTSGVEFRGPGSTGSRFKLNSSRFLFKIWLSNGSSKIPKFDFNFKCQKSWYFCILSSLNNRFLRERGMASNPKMEYQVFLCIFQKNSAMATLGLKEMGKFLWEGREKGLFQFSKTKLRQPTGQNFFSTFPKEFSHFLQT